MFKKVALIIGGVALLWAIWQYKLVYYGLVQAKGQLTILWQARPVQEVLADPAVADSVKNRIELVQVIKNYAVDSLGLNDPGSYQSYYDQEGAPVLWVLTACKPYSLKNKTWHFPLLGSFSYKGFFNKKMALNEQANLQQQGWDTSIRTASAWSTLGFFKDPILSEVLFRQKGLLADLIFHELTHATVFVKDSLSFNENLAGFVGNKGAEKFLGVYYGESSRPYNNYLKIKHDQDLFRQHMLGGLQKLDRLYNSFTPRMNKATKEKLKTSMIKSIIRDLDSLDFKHSGKYEKVVAGMKKEENLPNNAYFMAFKRYQSKQEKLSEIYSERFKGDLRAFIEYYKDAYGVY